MEQLITDRLQENLSRLKLTRAAEVLDTIVEKAWGGPSLERLEERWRSDISAILINATLVRPEDDGMATGGKAGRHSEHLGYMIAEMQYLQRVYPGANW